MACGFDWAAREDVAITRWLMLCDALTFPVGLRAVGFIPTASAGQESPTRRIVFFCLQMELFELQKEQGLASGSRVRF